MKFFSMKFCPLLLSLSLCSTPVFAQALLVENSAANPQVAPEELPLLDTEITEELPKQEEIPPEESEEVDSIPSASPTYHSWAEEQVLYAQSNSLVLASLGSNYTMNITRLQIAEILVNLVEKYTGMPLDIGTVSFEDEQSTAVLKAANSAIVGGKTKTTFDPEGFATRQEIAVMIYSSIKTMETMTGKSLVNHDLIPLSGYEDLSEADSWAKIPMAILANHNLMTGSKGKLHPRDNATIQECIVLVNNLFKL